MPPKLPLPRGWKRRVRSSVLHILALGLPDSTVNVPFFKCPKSLDHFTGRQPATLLQIALKVLGSAKYPTIQFRHITRRLPFRQ